MFDVGRIYNRRREIHEVYGGQRQGGISTPSKHRLIFLFTGPAGKQHGYHDEFRPDGTFWLTGEGQSGDMEMARGNLAIKEHVERGLTMHLFEEAGAGNVRYLGEVSYLGHHWEERPDTLGRPRMAVVFELDLETGSPASRTPTLVGKVSSSRHLRLWSRSLKSVRDIAVGQARRTATSIERRTIAYQRSEAVRVYVLRRAAGVCEGCENEAPFKTKDGRSYLEPHHIRRLSDGGPDDPAWVAGVCPNCHRAAHYARDAAQRNKRLAEIVGAKEEKT